MKKMGFISWLRVAGVLLAFLTLVAWQRSDAVQPASEEGFIADMQSAFADVHKLRMGGATVMQVHRRLMEYHLKFSKAYPVYYDWWLQDGDADDLHKWYWAESFDVPLNERLAKHGIAAEGDVQADLKAYLSSCTRRREQRLKEFIAKTPEVIFTKQRVLRPSFYAYTEGASDARQEFNFYPGGKLCKFKMEGIWARQECLLEDEDGGFRDPDVHFDGEHLLFAWKKSPREDDYHLYEMTLSDRSVKQLTFGLGYADIEGIYLPDDNILFNSTRSGNAADCWFAEVANMYICDREGRFMRQVGFDQVHTTTPTLLDDGRVVYTRWDYSDRGQIWTQPLFQMNADGTAQAEYYGMNSWFPTTVVHVKQIPGTRKVMGTFIGHHTPQHGKLGIIDPEAGRDENEGVMFVAPLRKPEAVKEDVYGQWGEQFQYPEPLNEREFLVSYSPLGYSIVRMLGRKNMHFGIYWMNVDGERELLLSDPNISCNHPTVLAPHKRPFNRASTVDYTREDGVYYMQNIYEGRSLEGIEPGTVKKLRVVEIIYRAASIGMAEGSDEGGGAGVGSPPGVGRTAWEVKKVWGVADVHPDGSAFFRVPARKPLYFQALDEKGYVVQTMRSWSTLMPGETQSCVGCHEHKNVVPAMKYGVSMAMKAGIQDLQSEDSLGVRAFSYMKEVQPIWDRHCVACHDGVKHKMSLKGDIKQFDTLTKRRYCDSYINLTHSDLYEPGNYKRGLMADPYHPEVNWISGMSAPTLLKPYHAGSATSNIIKRLENGHGGTKVTPEEIRRVALWIDLLVPFVSEYREYNAWTQQEMDFYNYYDNKRIKAREQERENIRQLIEYQKTQQR